MVDEDLLFAFEVYASTRREEMAVTGWSVQQIEKFLFSQATAQNNFYKENYKGASFQIVQLDGKDIGRLYVHEAKEELRIMDIAFLPEYRGKGIGESIMQNLIRRAEEKRVPATLHVEQNNSARRLFERIGFKFIEERGLYHFMKYTK